jgi:hypothetical protein
MAQPTEPAPALPTHAEGETFFHLVIEDLIEKRGWVRLRVDTLVRHDAEPRDRQQMTVRHQYDHGWELHLEKIRLWNPYPAPGAARKVIIRLDRPLPTSGAVLAELFGPRYTELTRPAPEEAA